MADLEKTTKKVKEKAEELKEKKNFFQEMRELWLELEKKWNLSYASWADVWDVFKSKYPSAYKIWHENTNWTLGFIDEFWGFAKVTVWVEGVIPATTTYLHFMDYRNQAIKKEKLTSTDINKTYQRCTVKAIAEACWLWLYVYRWEDLPSDWPSEVVSSKPVTRPTTATTQVKPIEKDQNDENKEILSQEYEYIIRNACEKEMISIEELKKLTVEFVWKHKIRTGGEAHIKLTESFNAFKELINSCNENTATTANKTDSWILLWVEETKSN